MATFERDAVSKSAGSEMTPPLHTGTEHPDYPRVNAQEAELLLHFVQSTAYTFADGKADDIMVRFWTHNLPRIGLTHHFTMHLAYAVAGYHLAYLEKPGERQQEFRQLAELHASAGLQQFTGALARLDSTNCGAAYVSATLVCYGTFAAGPTGPGDLLVCNIDRDRDDNWMPLIHGLRLIRETFDDDVLYTGLMDPFHARNHAKNLEPKPAQEKVAQCAREGLARLDWEQPLSDLREFVAAYYDHGDEANGIDESENEDDVCLRSLDCLINIYRATYGDKDGEYDGPEQYQHVFGWLYRIEKRFLSRLWDKDPRALIILAYFALLLDTMKDFWYLDGWERHILDRTRYLIGEEYAGWLRWPMEMAGLTR